MSKLKNEFDCGGAGRVREGKLVDFQFLTIRLIDFSENDLWAEHTMEIGCS